MRLDNVYMFFTLVCVFIAGKGQGHLSRSWFGVEGSFSVA